MGKLCYKVKKFFLLKDGDECELFVSMFCLRIYVTFHHKWFTAFYYYSNPACVSM